LDPNGGSGGAAVYTTPIRMQLTHHQLNRQFFLELKKKKAYMTPWPSSVASCFISLSEWLASQLFCHFVVAQQFQRNEDRIPELLASCSTIVFQAFDGHVVDPFSGFQLKRKCFAYCVASQGLQEV